MSVPNFVEIGSKLRPWEHGHTDTYTHTHTHRDHTSHLIICPMLCYSNGTDNYCIAVYCDTNLILGRSTLKLHCKLRCDTAYWQHCSIIERILAFIFYKQYSFNRPWCMSCGSSCGLPSCSTRCWVQRFSMTIGLCRSSIVILSLLLQKWSDVPCSGLIHESSMLTSA